MSIKKLGGIRLRLIVGLMAVLAIFGVVLAFAPKQTESITGDSVVGGMGMAYVELNGLQANTNYWLDLTAASTPYRGVVEAATQQANPYTNGFKFLTGYSPSAIMIDGDDATGGQLFVPLQTQQVTSSGQTSTIRLRADSSNAPGSVIDSDSLEILTQD